MSCQCRLISDEEFTDDLKLFIMKTFFSSEPMNVHLKTKIPDEIDHIWFDDVFQRAREDRLSLGFYDSTNSSSLPVAYAINHFDRKKRSKDLLYSTSTDEHRQKSMHINDLMAELHRNVDLFDEFQCENIFHIYFLGVDPNYRRKGFAGQLIDQSIRLASKNPFDLISADATSNYSFNAFIRRDFDVYRTIAYRNYENQRGEKIFAELDEHFGCSILLKDLRRK